MKGSIKDKKDSVIVIGKFMVILILIIVLSKE